MLLIFFCVVFMQKENALFMSYSNTTERRDDMHAVVKSYLNFTVFIWIKKRNPKITCLKENLIKRG